MELAELRLIWQGAGRPSAAKLRIAAQKRGLDITLKKATEFLKQQPVNQIFAPPPKSDGKITSPELNSRLQVDLLDFKARSPEKNDGFRAVLLCVDIFSRYLYTEPLKTKEPEEVAAAFQKILRRVHGNRLHTKSRPQPVREVTTDKGEEFKGPFAEVLEKHDILQTFKEGPNTLAIVDAAIRTLKNTLAKAMVDKETNSWVDMLPEAVASYNSNSHAGIMNAAPEDVSKTPVLQYELEKKSGYNTARNVALHKARVEKLSAAGAFRTLEPRTTWNRAGQARYSEKVHKIAGIGDKNVISTEGVDVPIKNVLPVAANSADVKVPSELKPGRPIREAGAKEALRPFAVALKGILGEDAMSLQGAGSKLRKIPGFAEAMTAHNISGIGSVQCFLNLFSGEFVMEGRAPNATVKVK